MLRCNKHVSVSYVRWKKCRSLASCCLQHDSPTLWIRNSATAHFQSTPWHRRLKPMWISHYINCLWRSLIFPDFTYSDVFRHTNKKNIGRFVSKLPNVWFQSLRCFFQISRCFSGPSKRTKGQKGQMWLLLIHLGIGTMGYLIDLYSIKRF